MKRVLVALGAASVLAAGGGTTVLLSDGDAQAADARSILCSQFVPNEKASWEPGKVLNKWFKANPGEVSRWTAYADGICAGETPVEPAVATLHGKTLLAAGMMALAEPEPPPTTTTEPPPTEPPPGEALACGSSLDAAYDAAAPGTVIELSDCSYAGKTITGSKSAPGVVFDLNGSDQGLVNVRATWLEFRDGSLDWYWTGGNSSGVYAPSDNVTFRNIKSTGVYVDGGTNISMIGGEIGPHASDQINFVIGAARNILFDSVYVHDNKCVSSGCHYEALRIQNSADGVIVRNSVFRRNFVFHIFLTSASTNYPKNVTMERNCFDRPDSGVSVIAIHDPVLTSLDPGPLNYRVIDNFAETGSNFRGPFAEFSGNVFGPESTCDTWIPGRSTP